MIMPWLCMLCKMCDVSVYSTNSIDRHSIIGHTNCDCNPNELERLLWTSLKNVVC